MSFVDLETELPKFLGNEINKESWAEKERLLKQFRRSFPRTSISRLTKKSYSQGHGPSNRSFCYEIEWGTQKLGHINGTPVNKFGLWYSKNSKNYRFTKKYGTTAEDALHALKDAIKALLIAGEKHDLDAINENPLSYLFKGKLLFLYFPDIYLNIFSPRHLHFFLDQLGMLPDRSEEIYLQDRIMQLKSSNQHLKKIATEQFSDFLYDQFGKPPQDDEITVPPKNQIQAKFVDDLPPGSSAVPSASITCEGNGNSDYGKRAKKLKAIGNRGEEIVLEIERKRLKAAGVCKKVKHVALTNDSKGYDVLSYEDDGVTLRYIEVKATKSKNLSRGFYLTENERQKSLELDNYYLYIVFDVKGMKPKIWKKKAPFSDAFFDLRPKQYQVFKG